MHFGISVFPQKTEIVISGRTDLQQSSQQCDTPGLPPQHPHLTYLKQRRQWRVRSAAPGTVPILIPFPSQPLPPAEESPLLDCWWPAWWRKTDGPQQIRPWGFLCSSSRRPHTDHLSAGVWDNFIWWTHVWGREKVTTILWNSKVQKRWEAFRVPELKRKDNQNKKEKNEFWEL